MRSAALRIGFALVILTLVSASGFAQGRGRGVGLGRRSDVFSNGHDRQGRFNMREANQDRKCGIFVNCHDARDGRWDGRGPRTSRNYNYGYARSSAVGYRRRYNMNDYWNRRHTTYVNNGWRYRNRSWRDR
jgi:hypothetical protein